MRLLRLLLSPFGGAVWFYVVLFLFCFAVGAVALLFGFSLGDVDNWFEANGGWIGTIGSLLFRLFCAFVLLMCAAIAAVCILEAIHRIRRRGDMGVRSDEKGESSCLGLGCGGLAAAMIGYFASFGLFY
jgi:vacuolar-type H+-ATPase subunit I/STV1